MARLEKSRLAQVRGVPAEQRELMDKLTRMGYELHEQLGEGSFSKVRKAWSNKLNQMVAIKIIDKRSPRITKNCIEVLLPRELEIMRATAHGNVLKMYDTMDTPTRLCIIAEYASHGDLFGKISLAKRIPETSARFIFRQLIEAVRYLHHKYIVHRDLKCENILFDRSDNVKLADFTFARYMKPDDLSKTFCGSRAYAPPEVLRGERYSGTAMDIWGLGIILYTIVTGQLPFDDRHPVKQINEQIKHQIPYHRSVSQLISPQVKDLISLILDPVPAQRPSPHKMLRQVWLRGTPWQMRSVAAALPGIEPQTQADTQPDQTLANLAEASVTTATEEEWTI